MATIMIIDDDMNMEVLVENLRYRGHVVTRLPSYADAMARIDEVADSDFVLLDVIMESEGSRMPGMDVYRTLRDRRETLPIVVYSASQDQGIREVLNDDPSAGFVSKWSGPSMRELIEVIYARVGLKDPPDEERRQPFIVHGHDANAKLELKNYLQNVLKLNEPIILHEQPQLGRTIIEKFENHAAEATMVFVLLTPDDKIVSEGNDDEKRRARQNVIFELGYFLGILGRSSGRVLLLHKGRIELPSDISGLVYIDISNGIEAAGESIRREVNSVF